MEAFGYGYLTAKAENIAAGNATAAATFDQWRNSPSHDANMRDPVTLPTNKARQAENRGNMFWVLTIGIVLVVIAFAAIYFGFFTAAPPNT